MSRDEYNNYLNDLTPAEIAAYYKDVFPEFGDLDVEELLIQQESALSYMQNNQHHGGVSTDYGESSNRGAFFSHDVESSHGDSQLALDEALARSLQELGADFDNIYLSSPQDNSVGNDNTRSTSREAPITRETQTPRQDDVDPDRMTYEELQSLGESIGNESKGLNTNLMSRLPSFKYKSSKNKNKENNECVICCSEYKKGVELTTLPCAHYYHSKCISHWLQLKKHCPVCQKEVQE